ncbi:MAG: SagB/ThcOx family dehydrogenase [Gammaproteobacteria bacterium]|nr:SagB/ThcOx family dehydrogenase [Gammaproteobacteria bacterium]
MTTEKSLLDLKGSIDVDVYNDILKMHAKEALTFIPFGNMCLSPVNPETIASIAAIESTFPSEGLKKTVIPCVSSKGVLNERQPSLRQFSKKMIDFSDIQTLLINAFSPNHLGHRPYPSAGALYPIEPILFIFKERVYHDKPFESGCYHFKPVSQTLDLIKKMEMKPTINRLFHGLIEEDAPPNLCILYVVHIGKSIFKYRYRGYRHALMEVGSMYQQVTMVSQSLGLGGTVWSGFNDYQLMHELGLNRRMFLPLTMQFLGYRELIK